MSQQEEQFWRDRDRARRAEIDAAGEPGRFQRSEDGQAWEEVDPQLMRGRLSAFYREVDSVIAVMTEDGQQVRTPYAFYRFSK